MYYFYYLPVTPAPDVLAVATTVSTTATTNTLNTSSRVQSLVQKIKDFITQQQRHIQNFVNKNKNHFQKIAQGAFMFSNAMRTLFQFFPIIILARIIVGLFQRPFDYIMMGVSMIMLSVMYVIYYIFSLYPLIYIPYLVWFLIFFIMPFIVYSIVILCIYIIILIFCCVIALINWGTLGSLRNLILCQNGPYAWYKTPNYQYNNKFNRGIFCSKPCMAGYMPDANGFSCVRKSYAQPNFCPYPEILRLYTTNKSDLDFYYKDYNIVGNFNYLSANPEKRERLLKDHYIGKLNYINNCDEKITKLNNGYKYIPLNICSSLDVLKDTMDPATINKLKIVCNQGFCNNKNNYPFCSYNNYKLYEQSSRIKDIITVIIYILVFIIIICLFVIYIDPKLFNKYINNK